MLGSLSLLLFIVSRSSGGRCKIPDGTDKSLYFQNCNSQSPIQLLTLTLEDDKGNVNYPVNLTKPVVIVATGMDQYSKAIKKLIASVEIAKYEGNLFCTWISIPTFGLLDNIDGCKISQQCPVTPGSLSARTPLDLRPYAPVLNALTGSHVEMGMVDCGLEFPFRFSLQLKEGDDGSRTEVACVVVEALVAH